MSQTPKQRRNGYETRRQALSAIEAELQARGYAMISGAKANVMDVVSPMGRRFKIRVASLYRRNAWKLRLTEQPFAGDTFYILALVPDGGPSQFFVMTEERLQQLIREDLKELGRPGNYPAPGLTWDHGEQEHLNAWNVLPA